MKRVYTLAFLLLAVPFVTGFDLDNAIVPREQILSGGPPRDGIPALLKPKFADAGRAGFMDAADQVIGVVVEGQPRAYPIKILNWHEVVNDVIGDTPITVTF